MNRLTLCVILLSLFAVSAASADEYDLETYLVLVERNNPDLLLRFKDIELAETDAALARSAFLPRAGVQGGYNRNFQDVRTNYDNELTMGIGITQILFSVGALSNYSKAKLGKAIREQSFEAARLAVLCAAKKLYARAELALLIVEIRESSERFSLEQYQRMERRRQAGAATEMDLLSAEVDWRTKADAIMEARKNAELVLLAFRDLAGIPHTQTIELTQVRTSLPELPENPNLGSILANRADYRALLLSKELSGIDRSAARNAFMPEVSASFNYAIGGMGNGSSLIGDYDFNSAAFGITINIPILAGGARLARMKAAKLEQEKTIIALSQKETAIESELKELHLRLEEAQRRSESSLRTVETARRAVALAQAAYTNGQATYLTIADAQDKLDTVWLNFANIGYEYFCAYYDWELAVGIKN